MNLRPFEITLISIFVALAIGGLLFLTYYKNSPNEEALQFGNRVLIWGPFSQEVIGAKLGELASKNKAFEVVRYEQYAERGFNGKLLTAIGEGNTPDLIIMPHTSLIPLKSILYPIPYTSYPVRSFKDAFIEGAELFMMKDGIYGVPFAVDPLVMYWNRDLFTGAGIANPPTTWENLLILNAPSLTKRTADNVITQSAVGLGEGTNITYAKEILSMLFFQAGSPIVLETSTGYRSALNEATTNALPAGDAALSFYTQFSSPSNSAYSWNRSLPMDRMQFISGNLALYFAPGSELRSLRRDNPNLNFDFTQVPQGAQNTVTRNYGTFYAFAIPKASPNKAGALQAAYALAQSAVTESITESLGIVPVTREAIQKGSSDADRKILIESALPARGWLDPNPTETRTIFIKMVEGVTSGQKRVSEAVRDAARSIELLFK